MIELPLLEVGPPAAWLLKFPDAESEEEDSRIRLLLTAHHSWNTLPHVVDNKHGKGPAKDAPLLFGVFWNSQLRNRSFKGV